MRPIDADALIKKWENVQSKDISFAMAIIGAINDVKKAPTIDAVPVRHGRWVERWVDNKHRIGDMECSVCGAPMLDCPSYSLYCPWCGAKMDEVEK